MNLSDAGNIASILSLLITGWMVYEIRSLHLFYKRHLLLPNFIRELERHSKNAHRALEAKRTEEFKGILQKCDALVERVPKYADNKLVVRIRGVRDIIAKILQDRDHNVLSNGREVINQIEATIESARAFTSEDKWSTRT